MIVSFLVPNCLLHIYKLVFAYFNTHAFALFDKKYSCFRFYLISFT